MAMYISGHPAVLPPYRIFNVRVGNIIAPAKAQQVAPAAANAAHAVGNIPCGYRQHKIQKHPGSKREQRLEPAQAEDESPVSRLFHLARMVSAKNATLVLQLRAAVVSRSVSFGNPS